MVRPRPPNRHESEPLINAGQFITVSATVLGGVNVSVSVDGGAPQYIDFSWDFGDPFYGYPLYINTWPSADQHSVVFTVLDYDYKNGSATRPSFFSFEQAQLIDE